MPLEADGKDCSSERTLERRLLSGAAARTPNAKCMPAQAGEKDEGDKTPRGHPMARVGAAAASHWESSATCSGSGPLEHGSAAEDLGAMGPRSAPARARAGDPSVEGPAVVETRTVTHGRTAPPWEVFATCGSREADSECDRPQSAAAPALDGRRSGQGALAIPPGFLCGRE